MAYAFTFLTLAALATAQSSSILTLPFYGYDQQPIVASVLSANPTATTLSLTCAPGTDASDCGLFPAQTLTIGPSTYNMFMGEGSAFTGTQDCSSSGTAKVVCQESNAGSGANYPGSSTEGYEGTDVVQIPVTVTAGVEALGGGGGSASTGSSGSSAPASASATATSSGEVTMLTGTASSASRSGSESSSSTGSATGSAAAMTSSSAASVDGKVGGGMLSLIMTGAGMVGYWMS